jgi:thiol:disulfide interchange protein
MRLIAILILLFFVAQLNALTTPHVTADLVSESWSVPAGGTTFIGVRFKIIPKWHIYWKNAGDSGTAPNFKFNLPAGTQLGDVVWPVPKRLQLGPLANYGYEKEVLLMFPLSLTAEAKFPLQISLDADWLVCKEECIPESGKFQLVLSEGNFQTNTNSKLFASTRENFPQVNSELHLSAGDLQTKAASEAEFTLSGVPMEFEKAEFDFFPEQDGLFEAGEKAAVTSRDKNKIAFKLTKAPSFDTAFQQNEGPLRGLAIFQDKGNVQAFAVDAQFGSIHEEPIDLSKFFWAIVSAFVGGIILNLMPCVFPVLVLKIMGLTKATAERRLRTDGLAYSAGVVLSFLVLALAIMVLKFFGQSVGWGFQLQSPTMLFFLIMLFFAMGLSFIGFIEFGNSLSAWVGRQSFATNNSSAFFTGVLATIVATPCTAPFMGAALGYALLLPTFASLAIFFMLGLGMAFPFLILSIFPQLAKWVPRPGAWMERLKELLAFPLFATVAWLLSVFLELTSSGVLVWVLLSLVSLSFFFWILKQNVSKVLKSFFIAVSFLLMTYFSFVSLTASGGEVSEGNTKTVGGVLWQNFSPQLVEKLRAEKRLIYLDFTASWCLSCQVNKKIVFSSTEVKNFMMEHKVALVRADWTRYDAAITKALAKYNRSGVPLNVIYGPNGSETILPTLLTPSIVLTALRAAEK